MKKYLIYAGVNGAGKSTLYYSSPYEDIPRINTDEMVRQMGNWEGFQFANESWFYGCKKNKGIL